MIFSRHVYFSAKKNQNVYMEFKCRHCSPVASNLLLHGLPSGHVRAHNVQTVFSRKCNPDSAENKVLHRKRVISDQVKFTFLIKFTKNEISSSHESEPQRAPR